MRVNDLIRQLSATLTYGDTAYHAYANALMRCCCYETFRAIQHLLLIAHQHPLDLTCDEAGTLTVHVYDAVVARIAACAMSGPHGPFLVDGSPRKLDDGRWELRATSEEPCDETSITCAG